VKILKSLRRNVKSRFLSVLKPTKFGKIVFGGLKLRKFFILLFLLTSAGRFVIIVAYATVYFATILFSR